jgi:hypothetical protein
MSLFGCLQRMLIAPLTFLVLTAAGSASAQSSVPPHLAGWWIAVDNVAFPPLWRDGTIVPMEELLIIESDGRFENRMMGFYGIDPGYCAKENLCSDAPLIATGRLALSGSTRATGTGQTFESGNKLLLSDISTAASRIDSPRGDPIIRARSVSATSAWMVEGRVDVDDGMLLLRRAAGEEPRAFVKTAPEKLRRLRAGIIVSELSALQHWRCYLASATGGDVRSMPLRNDKPMLPAVRDYIAAAHYYLTALTYAGRPTVDDPDPAQRRLAGVALEDLMVGSPAKLPQPRTVQERREVKAVARYLTVVVKGEQPEAAKAMMAREFPGVPLRQDLAEAEILALTTYLRGGADRNRLFCAG